MHLDAIVNDNEKSRTIICENINWIHSNAFQRNNIRCWFIEIVYKWFELCRVGEIVDHVLRGEQIVAYVDDRSNEFHSEMLSKRGEQCAETRQGLEEVWYKFLN